MARLPEITVTRWTEAGPEYTIHHVLSGWRNRRARRAGEGDERVEHEGADDMPADEPLSYMVLALGEYEVWAFRAGHVYRAEVLIDGDAAGLLVDAREEDQLQTYGPDISLLEIAPLDEDELAELLDGNPPAQPTNVSDGAESQEPIVALTGAQVEETAETATALDAALTPGTAEHAAVVEQLGGVQPDPEAPAEVQETTIPEPTPEAEEVAPAEQDAPAADEDEPSTGDSDFDGTVAEFEELAEAMTGEELAAYAELDSRKGVREYAAKVIEAREPATD